MGYNRKKEDKKHHFKPRKGPLPNLLKKGHAHELPFHKRHNIFPEDLVDELEDENYDFQEMFDPSGSLED